MQQIVLFTDDTAIQPTTGNDEIPLLVVLVT